MLLVDDNEFDRVALDAMLRRHGFRVISAESYAIGLAALRSDMQFAGFVVDYYLARPNPKDDTKLAGKVEFSTEPNGFDLLLEAKRLRPSAARILITTDPIAQNLEPLFDGRWFNKHNSAGGLVRLLREMLEMRG